MDDSARVSSLLQPDRAVRQEVRHEPVDRLVARMAAACPDRVAIEGPEASLTYAELAARSAGLARHLLARGLAAGDRAAILAEDPLAVIPAVLAVLAAGGVFVPLDPQLPGPRLAALLTEVAPRWVLAEARWSGLLAGPAAAAAAGASVLLLDGAAPAAGPDPIPIDRSPDAPCYIVFTSGSTGRPKGIVGRLKGIDHFVRWEIALVGAAEGIRVSQLTTPAFDAFLRDVFVPLCAGGTVCLPPDRASRLAPARLVSWLDESQVQLLHCVPSLLRSLLAQDLGPRLFPALRWVLLAGETLLPADVRRWMEVFGERAQLVNLYGPSETTMTKLFYRVRPADRAAAAIPIGRPMDGARVVVLGESGAVCPPGVAGEILIRTPFRSLGYLDRPELTREVFVPNPLSGDPRDIVYRTGDLGRLRDDDELEFLGRRDDQVKIRGVRVEPAEAAGALREHPRVRDAVVVAFERDDGPALCAYAAADGDVAPEELRAFLQRSLPESLVPAAFVVLDRLPRTLTGKVDRAALPPPPARERQPYVAPRTPAEELLAGLWQDLLRSGPVGIHDNFFALSGHSLLALRMLSRIRDLFAVEVALGDFLGRQDLAALAARVDELQRGGPRAAAPPPLVPMPREGDLPLSFGQQRLWFLDRLDPGRSAYTIAVVLDLTGDLAVLALAAAFTRVTARHEVLRTTFGESQGSPVQRIAPPRRFALPVVDLAALTAWRRGGVAERLAAAAARSPFDLSRGPLLRALLLRRSPTAHDLVVAAHHTVVDNWSLGILVRDLGGLYRELVTGEPAELPPLPVQYADFAVWQRGWLRGPALAEQLAYWREGLRQAPALELPADRPRPPVLGSHGARVGAVLPAALAQAAAELSRREGVTLFMTLLGAFAALLHRYSGQDDVVVGTPAANRGRSEVENLVGFFVNTLALRTDLSGDPALRQLARRIRRTALGAYSHQDLPFERLVEELQPRRDLSRHPLFQVMLVLQYEMGPRLALPGLEIRARHGDVPRANFDLTLGLLGGGGALPVLLDYNRELFDPATARRLLGHFRELLAAAAAAPDTPVSLLPLLSAAEVHQTVREWQGEPLALPPGVTLHGLFAARAALAADAVALVGEGEAVTYGELLRRSRAVARRLRAAGVGPERVVGLCLERSPRLVAGLLGILEAGGAYLPLDLDLPRERLAWMLADSGAALVLAEVSTLGAVPEGVVAVVLDGAAEAGAAGDGAAEAGTAGDGAAEVGAGPGHLAYVLYTSGSSGQPKGVMVPHGGVCATLLWRLRDFGLSARDTVLQNIPLTFDPSVWQIFGALLAGARLVLVPPGRHQDALWLRRAMRDEGVSITDFPPSLLRVLLESGALAESAALRCLFVGGEAFPPELRDRGHALLAAGLYNVYGPTEACIDIACWDCGREASGLRVPIGRPIAGKRVFLLDAAQQPVPVGVPGELHAGGDGLARGYAGRPDLTAAAFVPSPFAAAPGERLYRTGDRVRFRPDGALEFLGRTDRQVKVRGRRIELGEIEALLGRHPQVREAAVVVREDSPGEPRLVAYCVAAPEAPTPAALAAFLRRSLPDPLVPSAFVTLAALPATANGKLDLAALPAPPAAVGAGSAAPAAPRTGLERTLAEVWGAVLQIEQPGIDDDFFALGGHSLLLVRAQVRLAAALGRAVPIVELFAHPTIRSLARHLAGDGEEDGFAAEEERARLQLAARRRQRDRLRAREPEVVS